MITRIRKAMDQREDGFTLIELLVVVIIIGILAAIAIPTFLNQREKAWRRAAESDLRNAATEVESDFSDAGTYAGATGWKNSEGVAVTLHDATTTAYCLRATHTKLAGAVFVLKSAVGRPQKVGEAGATDCAVVP